MDADFVPIEHAAAALEMSASHILDARKHAHERLHAQSLTSKLEERRRWIATTTA